ncbi:MAG: hypothetical protein JXR37_07030 [Kiritimatiellae bacterium]|nr:hypothetical protein [Kiritimatiellia bacterium]
MKRVLTTALALTLLTCATCTEAGEIGFVEAFSLAPDRSVPLKQLIPGTEEYYYYHCLHYQHTGDYAKVHELLAQWIKRHRYTERVKELQNRQALLEYARDPQKSLAHIRNRLNLQFAHQKRELDRKPAHPTRLDPALISRATLTRRAFAEYSNLNGFEDSALDFLVAQPLDPDRRRDLLRRLERPDYPGLARLVVDDLNHAHSGGFGSHRLHRELLLAQLDECLALMPGLLNNENFVQAYLTKLHPSPDVQWPHDPAEKQAFLDRQWQFVQRLAPAHNSLKAHVLYQRLALDRSRGAYDRARFMAYIQLPRNVPYINTDYVRRPEHRNNRADLRAEFGAYTLLPAIGDDEQLVRDYLEHFLVQAPDYDAFLPYIRQSYLQELFAETKIVNGIGDMEQWYSLLPPARYKALKERVDIEFLPANPDRFAVGDPVELEVAVKNVEKLIVKTYEINALNYYREKKAEISTGIDLDGLVANDERLVAYTQVPLRRHVERFAFPRIDRPGVWVVEFIGNGRSSRALIRKGRLTFTERTGAAGHVFRVYDEAGRRVKDAQLQVAGHAYTPDAAGEIVVPYSTRPGRQPVIVRQGDFAALHEFAHAPEHYALAAGIHADREALLAGQVCKVLVRPELTLNGIPVDIGLLEEAAFSVQATDYEGTGTTKDMRAFELHNDREAVCEFTVPPKLATLVFTLSGKVQSLTTDKKVPLATSVSMGVNGIERTEQVDCLHLRHAEAGYSLELLGKTGEPKPDRPVQLELKHRDFKKTVHATVQTDEHGRIELGELGDIVALTATGPDGPALSWAPEPDRHSYSGTVHGRVGEALTVPVMAPESLGKEEVVSLLELRGDTFARDCRDSVQVRDGFLSVEDLPAGDYDLWLKRSDTRIRVRLTRGERDGAVLVSRDRCLETVNERPLQIAQIGADKSRQGNLRIALRNAADTARVHVLATRYVPAHDSFACIGAPAVPAPGLIALNPRLSQYLSGRNIGDEYRYVLERKYAQKFPGNLLKRPSLLLAPWSLRKTEAGKDKAQAGEAWAEEPAPMAQGLAAKPRSPAPGRAAGQGAAGAGGDFAGFDFLPQTTLILANLRPDKDGVVSVELAALGARQHVHVLAVDAQNTVYRQVALPAAPERFKDLRLARPLDVARHFSEQKNITAVAAGTEFAIEDTSTAEMEVYDTLAAVHALFTTLSGDATLAEFAFVLNWPDLNPEQKRELYSRYACHELNFFLCRKDPAFFAAVVKPHIRNKKDKTFLDHWLIEDDLAPWLEPWAYGRLNIVERILLAQRLRAEAAPTARHVKDLYDLIPPDLERFNHLFDTALKRGALETAAKFDMAFGDAAPAPEGWAAPTGLGGGAAHAFAALGAVRMEADMDEIRPAAAPAEAEEKALLREATRPSVAAEARRDVRRRKEVRRLYRKLDKTEEWVENNYYHLPIEEHLGARVSVNGFWQDYAAHAGGAPFVSTRLAEAAGNFTEMLFALGVLDLPFKAADHKTARTDARLALTPGSAVVVFHKEIREARPAAEQLPILVSQNFFAHDDRYRHENNERFDKFVKDEFRSGRTYGAQVVLTNPTSARRKVDVLLQIPSGALPVLRGFYTRSFHCRLEPYSTRTLEYRFYFPAAGTYTHYPVHVAENETLIGFTAPFTFNVVDTLTKIDRDSWPYISQNGSNDDVLRYLREHNVERLDLELIAFRMRDKAFFSRALALLEARHVYHDTLWSYGIYHDATPAARAYLQHSPFAEQCGLFIDTPLLTLDPVRRHVYQHKEYWPLVNARTYQLGATRKILNEPFFAQYTQWLEYLAYRPALSDTENMAVTVYLLLQDRVADALDRFALVDRAAIAPAVQYDYLQAYLALCAEKPQAARTTAERYRDYGVDRWRNLFGDILAQLDEIEGKTAAVVDQEDRTQIQTRLADTAAGLEFSVEDRRISVQYQNLAACTVNYYLMDIELLFSRNPFVQEVSGQFSIIRPNASKRIELPADQHTLTFELPAEFRASNVMIEITGGGVTKAQAYYPHSLGIRILENYGQIRITDANTQGPLAKVYVKVHARMKDGRVEFYKDGYTDLRGRFDYTSLNTDELDQVARFAILILSEAHGAVVREANPPKM